MRSSVNCSNDLACPTTTARAHSHCRSAGCAVPHLLEVTPETQESWGFCHKLPRNQQLHALASHGGIVISVFQKGVEG